MLVRSSLWHLNILCSCLKLRCQSKCSVSNRGLLIKILKFDFTDIWPFPVYAFVESLLEILGSHYGNHVSIALFNWIWNVRAGRSFFEAWSRAVACPVGASHGAWVGPWAAPSLWVEEEEAERVDGKGEEWRRAHPMGKPANKNPLILSCPLLPCLPRKCLRSMENGCPRERMSKRETGSPLMSSSPSPWGRSTSSPH